MGAYTIPIFDPQGTLRDIPAEQAHDAVASGGKPGVRFQAPDGKVRYVPADQSQDAINAGGKLLPFEQQDQGVKAWYGFTPSNVAKNAWEGFKGIVGGTYDVAKDLVNNSDWVQGDDSTLHKFVKAPSDDQVKKASKALESGNRVEAAGHILASALPLVGPWAAGLGEQAGTGDIGGAVGSAAGTIAGGEALARAPGLAKGAAAKAGGLVKAGTGEIVQAAGATLAPTPTEAMTKALKPTAGNTGFDTAMETAFPDLKRAEAATGKPVQGVNDLLPTISAAKKAVWQEYQAKLNQANATGAPTIDGGDIADAMEASVTKRQAQLNPQLAEKVKTAAATYRRPMTLDEAEDFLQDANNELHSYYAKNKVGQRAALADPEMASTVAEVNQLRDSLYSKLDDLTGPGAADIKQRYGALSNVEEEALRRKNVAARQQPESLAEQLGKAAGVGKAVAGAATAGAGVLTGSPHAIGAGATLAGEGVMQAGLSKWLKGRQTTDALIKNAFENYGQPPSMLRNLVTGTRGEAGAPGTVREEDETAVPAEQRRTPAQTRVDTLNAAARDPQLRGLLADAEAQRAQREAAFTQQRQDLGPLGLESQRPTTTPPPGPEKTVPSLYEKYGQNPITSIKTPDPVSWATSGKSDHFVVGGNGKEMRGDSGHYNLSRKAGFSGVNDLLNKGGVRGGINPAVGESYMELRSPTAVNRAIDLVSDAENQGADKFYVEITSRAYGSKSGNSLGGVYEVSARDAKRFLNEYKNKTGRFEKK
jgi:hypothetical protein